MSVGCNASEEGFLFVFINDWRLDTVLHPVGFAVMGEVEMTGRKENGIGNDGIVSPVTRRDGRDLFNKWGSGIR